MEGRKERREKGRKEGSLKLPNIHKGDTIQMEGKDSDKLRNCYPGHRKVTDMFLGLQQVGK